MKGSLQSDTPIKLVRERLRLTSFPIRKNTVLGIAALAVVADLQLFSISPALAQSISPATDGTGTIVAPNGNQYDITGGTLSRDQANLFHSFQKFGLNDNEIANFLAQPNIQNILGRVVGGDASVISGLIQVQGGNANLYLINPAGIVFGGNASLNVPASFVATTATGIGFDNNSWLNASGANNYQDFVGTPSLFAFNTVQPGVIVNNGNLAVTTGNNLTLLGGTVINTGSLTAPSGNITIAAVPDKNLVRMSQQGHLLSLEISPLSTVDNNQSLTPLSLPQLLTGGDVNNATGIKVNPDGTVQLVTSGVNIVARGGTAITSGSVNVSGETGGTVQLLGNKVALVSANINASGNNGGGNILVGGDFQGKGKLPNASHTFINSDSILNASAISNGNGGRVIAWADSITDFAGKIIARGGANSGDGGFVEVSGKEKLEFKGFVDTAAPNGSLGTLLLDPRNIIISPTPPPGYNTILENNAVFADGNYAFDENPDEKSHLTPTTVENLLLSNSVTLQANNDIGIEGNINSTSSNSLSLQAGRNITIIENKKISLNGGNFSAKINDENAIASQREAGMAQFLMLSGSEISTNGGKVTITHGNNFGDVNLNTAKINSGTGDIEITGSSERRHTENNFGIFLGYGSTVAATGNGNITMTGKGGPGLNYNDGIFIGTNSKITSENGSINLTGNGQGTGISNTGVELFDRSFVAATGKGNITINGIGGAGTEENEGIRISDLGSKISSAGGNITLIGTGNGTGTTGYGILINRNALVETTGNGNVLMQGSSTNGDGIRLSEGFINPSDNSNGNVSLTGDEINLLETSEVKGKGVLQLQPLTPSLNITVGGTNTDNGLNLDSAELAKIKDGFSQMIIGRDNSSGAITVSYNSFREPLTIQSPEGTGSITTTEAIATSDNVSITLKARQNITINKALSSPVSLSLSSDEIDLLGGTDSVSTPGSIVLQPMTVSQDITVGGTTNDSRLNLDNTDLAALKDGSSQITIGRSDGTGIVSLDNSATLKDPVYIAGGSTLVAPDRKNIWTITGLNQGSIDGFPNGLTFANIENLQGGITDDTFKFKTGSFISGNVNAVNVFDTLDYSEYTEPVTVNLAINKATGIGGSVSSIEGAIGGTGNNTLIAANTNNTWNLTSNNGGNINGDFTFSNFQNLTGGTANDTFKFSDQVKVSGVIDGNDGFDTLDYSAYTTPVVVNLPANFATNTGGVFNFEEVKLPNFPSTVPTPSNPPVNPPLQQQPPTTIASPPPQEIVNAIAPAPQTASAIASPSQQIISAISSPVRQSSNLIAPPREQQIAILQVESQVPSVALGCVFPRENAFNDIDTFLPSVAAYMNSNGGALSISIDNLLPGCSQELIALKGNQELIKQHLTRLVSQFIGQKYTNLVEIKFASAQRKITAIVEVAKSPTPAFVNDGRNVAFYVRQGQINQLLTPDLQQQYIQENWQ